MEWQKLCTNCMLAQTTGTVCPHCGMPFDAAEKRDMRALPNRYILHGRYLIGRVLGVGGFGITYLAYDCLNHCRVAVKELFPCKDIMRKQGTSEISVLKGQEQYFGHIRQRFMDEAKILYQFRNWPEVVDVYQLFEENNTAYYVMEYLEGSDLKHFLVKNGRLSWEKMAVYTRMIVRTLNTLHGKGLIHRDISPDNIFLTRDGRARLIDFGSVRCYSNMGGFTAFLKECFAPPEQYQEHGKQGPWTDIYSLSVTMYYALSGVMPPKAPDRIRNDQTIPLQKLCPDMVAYISGAITKGMSVRQEERFQNVKEFAKALFPKEQLFESVEGRTGQYVLSCVEGYYEGRNWSFRAGLAVTIGRDARCTIIYPSDRHGVSRRQCSLMLDRYGRLYVRDEKSSYGTFLNGRRLQPQKWYQIMDRSSLNFGQETYYVYSGGQQSR